ncbi:MAG: hypothetical protein H6709_01285 [Kofleriaceae bacterium]|nr:hypothetical protein [Myxococcales bacterium]MCB9570702.1 hypothetical protein [Kofleriaceae bacterium]
MSDDRGPAELHAVPAQYRCQACLKFVTGSSTWACPNCGWRPPHAPRPPKGGWPAPRRERRVEPMMVVVVIGVVVAAMVWWLTRG